MNEITEGMLAYALNYLLSGMTYDNEPKANEIESNLIEEFKEEFGYDIEPLLIYR